MRTLLSPAQAQEDTGIAPQPSLRQNGKEFKNLLVPGSSGSWLLSAGIGI